jgi:hypothetical protein
MSRIVVSLLTSIVLLAACGGDDGGGGSVGGGGGEEDAHAMGETVSVGYADASDQTSTTLDVTVLDVREGTQDELSEGGLEVDPEDQSSTPYYVDAKYENTGDGTVPRSMDVSLEDADGNLINSVVIFDFGDQGFAPCENVSDGNLKPGDSFEDCTLFLVPEGLEVSQVSFFATPKVGEPSVFIYWDIE